jgi:hypothetical protein
MKLEVELLPDFTAVKVRMGDWVARIETVRLELFIQTLAEARGQMKPEVPHEFEKTNYFYQLRATEYKAGFDHLTLLPTLALRTESFGWIKFDFDRDTAKALAERLRDCALQEEDTSKPN